MIPRPAPTRPGRKRKRRYKLDSYDLLRKRILEETELAILIGLQFPERAVRIPTVEAGTGSFDPDFSARFWQELLELDEATLKLLSGPDRSDRSFSGAAEPHLSL